MDDPMEDIDRRSSSSEEEYDENADEDFNPEAANAEAEQSSSSDEEPQEKETTKRGRKSKKRKSEDDGEILNADLDSGDEATIQERKRKKRRKQEDAPTGQDEDSGGEGGFIRTRAQRIIEKEERKHRKRARDGAVTIDVDQVWKDLSSAPIGRASLAPPPEPTDIDDVVEGNKENAPNTTDEDPNELITIKRRIEFAGEITEIEEKHPRASKEAQKYLAEHPEADPKHPKHPSNLDPSGVQKPLKRPSIFEPNPAGNVKGVAPEKLRRHAPTKTEGLMSQKLAEMRKNTQKMSTVQKSQLDWKGFVDKEGLRDELNEYGKSKRGFLAREAFLDRAAGAREQAARDARSRL